jgi:acyl-CoA dehydrogenase
MFLLDMRCPGVTVRPIKQITGAQHFNEVFLDEVRVPATELLGAPGEGWKVARITLMHERLGLISRRRVEVGDLLALVRGASFDGQRMIVRDDVRQEMAEIWMRALALRSLGQKTLASIADGEIPGPEGSIGKLAGAQLLNQMGRFATNLLGPGALLDGPDSPDGGRWQYAFLDATARRIAGGSDEIQRNIIAERVLGMPRDR